jgi:DNA-binding GntR family transcriptional regulator
MDGNMEFVVRDNLTARVYRQLREGLMEGRFWPGHRLKIRDLAASMGVSETPVREAVMQLVCEKGLRMQAARSITVAELSLSQYLELRNIRLHLEGMAAEAAATNMTARTLATLQETHERLTSAEETGDWVEAIRANWAFHHTLYQAANLPELLSMIEGIWLRNGPLVNYLYPHARPTYSGRHQHLNIIAALHRRDTSATRKAIQDDMLEGGTLLVGLLRRLDRGELTKEDLRAAARSEGGQSGEPAAPKSARR